MAKHTVKRKYIAAATEDRDSEYICGVIEKKMHAASADDSAESFDAKSMLLFGNSLFPENFRMKFQSYKIAKQSGDVERAAQLFRTMYLSFPNEQSFYAELCAVIEDVRTEQRTTGTDLFQGLSKNMQCEILLKFCQTSASTLDEVNLKVFIMRSYPHTIREHAFDVIEALSALERESYPHDPLNVYRERLACDLLPLVFMQMCKKKELDSKTANKLLLKSLTFYLTYGLLSAADGTPPAVRGSTEEHSRLKDPWLSARQLLDAVSSYHSWGSLSLPRLPRQAAQANSAQSQQTSEEFVNSLDQALLVSRSPHRLVLPLLVAHVEVTTGYLQRSKPSATATVTATASGTAARRGASGRPGGGEVGPSLWLCTIETSTDEVEVPAQEEEEEEEGDAEAKRRHEVGRWLELAVRVWRHACRLPKEARKDFEEALRQLRLDSWHWLDIFYAEAATLLPNPFKECQAAPDRLAHYIPQPARLFLDAQAAWERDRAQAVRHLILCLQAHYSLAALHCLPGQGDQAADVFPAPADFPRGGMGPRPQLTALGFPWLFNLTVHLLLGALTPVCRRVMAWNHDAYGHALVLLQWDLSANEVAPGRVEFLKSILAMIRQYGALRYPRFFSYVISPDVLEEVVLLQRSAARPARMILAEDIGGEGEERPSPADEAQLAKHAQMQIEKCYQPLGPVIYEFLVNEAEQIANCFT